MSVRRPPRFPALIVLAVWIGCASTSSAANWSITPGSALTLDTSVSGLTVSGMSGVSYLGPSPVVGKHRFLAVQDTGAGIITFDAEFDLNGGLLGAEAISNRSLSSSLDFEGIALADNGLFLSEENGPGVRQFNADTGAEIQSIAIPSVFTSNVQGNRGFESLAYDTANAKLWTANEEALSVDGALATSASGTTVRLLELAVNGSNVTAGNQFAYQVDPIHGSNSNASTRSGLVELVVMPDNTLVAMERSLAAGFSPYQNRLYEVDFAGATDVSVAPFDEGLTGETFSAVAKELVWTGSAAGGFGQNLEGLTVGPRLPSGDWILLGVVDDGGSTDFLSGNTVVGFIASPTTPIPFAADSADFDDDGSVDGDDLLAWQRGLGVATLAGLAHGDANHDGAVGSADLAIWQSQYSPSPLTDTQAIPEPNCLALVAMLGISAATFVRRRLHSGAAN